MPFSMVNQIYLQDIKSYGNNFHDPHDRICLLSYGQILQDVNQTARPLIQILLTGLGFFLPEISPLSEKTLLSRVGRVTEGTALSGNTFPFTHWRFWAQGLQLNTSFFYTLPKKWQYGLKTIYFASCSLQSFFPGNHRRGWNMRKFLSADLPLGLSALAEILRYHLSAAI